jgi:hypothetical protein
VFSLPPQGRRQRKPIQQRHGRLGIAENAGPFVKAEVGRDDDRGALVKLAEQLKQLLPGEEVWLVGEHRLTGEREYYLSNLTADAPIKQLAGPVKPIGSTSRLKSS